MPIDDPKLQPKAIVSPLVGKPIAQDGQKPIPSPVLQKKQEPLVIEQEEKTPIVSYCILALAIIALILLYHFTAIMYEPQ